MSMPASVQNISPTVIQFRDLLFAGINGAIFGTLLPFVLQNINIDLGIPFLIYVLTFSLLAIFGVSVGYVLSRIRRFFFQLSKFSAVGAANAAIDFGVLNILLILSGISAGIFFIIFKFISFLAATINSYLWNKYWSFEDKSKDDIKGEMIKFLTISGIGVFINVSVAGLINAIGPSTIAENTWANIAAGIAAITVLAWNFLGYKFVVFKK